MSAPPEPPDTDRGWTAEIEWRTTEDGARFIAVARPAGEGPGVTIAESPQLVWPPRDAGSVQALVDAANELDATLVGAGWAAVAPGAAWYARRFAWEPAGLREDLSAGSAPPAPLFAPRPAWPETTADRWRCEIAWDAGWADSRFRALAYAPRRRRGLELNCSRPLKWRLMAQPDPASPEDRHELDDLISAVAARGWERAGRGSTWYAERFYWPADEPPAVPETAGAASESE